MCEDKQNQNNKTHELMWRMLIEQCRMTGATVFIAGVALTGIAVPLLDNQSCLWKIGGKILFLIGIAAMLLAVIYIIVTWPKKDKTGISKK